MELHIDWTAKDYLDHVKELDDEINSKLKELSDLKSRSTSIGSFDYSKDKVQTSPSGEAPYVRLVNKMYDLEKEIDALTDEYVDDKNATNFLVRSTLTEDDYRIFTQRYWDHQPWAVIAHLNQMSRRNVLRRYKKIMHELEITTYWGADTV